MTGPLTEKGGLMLDRRIKDLTGMKFGRLTVSQITPKRVGGNVVWSCRCTCGNQSLVTGGHLTSGNTTSCGCLNAERVSAARRIHGHGRVDGKKSPTYKSWDMMKQRCNNPKATGYKNYGGKGIEVCSRWQEFHQFLFDMGERPEGYTLSRKDHNSNYEPSNCRWERAGTH